MTNVWKIKQSNHTSSGTKRTAPDIHLNRCGIGIGHRSQKTNDVDQFGTATQPCMQPMVGVPAGSRLLARQRMPAKAGLLMPMMAKIAAKVISVAAEVEIMARIGLVSLAKASVTDWF